MSSESSNTDTAKTNPGPQKAVNCLKCAYFKVTWDTKLPRSCEIFGFKSYNLPSLEVFRATGGICPSFKLKEGLK